MTGTEKYIRQSLPLSPWVSICEPPSKRTMRMQRELGLLSVLEIGGVLRWYIPKRKRQERNTLQQHFCLGLCTDRDNRALLCWMEGNFISGLSSKDGRSPTLLHLKKASKCRGSLGLFFFIHELPCLPPWGCSPAFPGGKGKDEGEKM